MEETQTARLSGVVETFDQYMQIVKSLATKSPHTFDDVYWSIELKTKGKLGTDDLYKRAVKRCKQLGINLKT